METLTIRDTTADLPVLDATELADLSMLQPEDGRLALFSYSGKDLRALELTNTQLYDGRISEVSAKRWTSIGCACRRSSSPDAT